MTHELSFRHLAVPVARRHFADCVTGAVCVCGEIGIVAADIVELARH